MTVNHNVEPPELQLQPAVVVTEIVPLAAVDGAVTEPGDTVKVQAAASVTVKVAPPAVIVPVRAEELGFAAALNTTVPLPVPLPAAVIVNQLALLVAVHAQPAPATTPTELMPPVPDID